MDGNALAADASPPAFCFPRLSTENHLNLRILLAVAPLNQALPLRRVVQMQNRVRFVTCSQSATVAELATLLQASNGPAS